MTRPSPPNCALSSLSKHASLGKENLLSRILSLRKFSGVQILDKSNRLKISTSTQTKRLKHAWSRLVLGLLLLIN